MPNSIHVTPLGISGALPAHGRHLSGLAVRRQGRTLLFDCGEGTQLQLQRARLLGATIDAVFITHLHGDHFYGLPGLVGTMALQEREQPLHIIGPTGVRGILTHTPGLELSDLPYPIHIHEIQKGVQHEVVYSTPDYYIEARPLAHRISCFGYRFQEHERPGKFDAEAARAAGIPPGPEYRRLARGETVQGAEGPVSPSGIVGAPRPGIAIAYCLDTAPCQGSLALASGVDLLVHDSTFGDSEETRAAETGHSTSRQAARVADEAEARSLLLTHFSARYRSLDQLLDQAREVFPESACAAELSTVEIPHSD